MAIIGDSGPGRFTIQDLGGWYAVGRIGAIDTDRLVSVYASTGSLEEAKAYLAKVRRAYRHRNSKGRSWGK